MRFPLWLFMQDSVLPLLVLMRRRAALVNPVLLIIFLELTREFPEMMTSTGEILTFRTALVITMALIWWLVRGCCGPNFCLEKCFFPFFVALRVISAKSHRSLLMTQLLQPRQSEENSLIHRKSGGGGNETKLAKFLSFASVFCQF